MCKKTDSEGDKMREIKESTEEEMILDFLKGEIDSVRFSGDLIKVLKKLKLNETIINNGETSSKEENLLRLKIMNLYREYPDKELFENFPNIEKWKYVQLNEKDINKIFYIDYDYWNELSNNTSSPLEAVKNIKKGIEIYGVSNKPFIDGVEYLKENTFPPVILITCNDEKYLIIEGHSRMTIYGFIPEKLNGTYAYIGYCTEEEMRKYDERMLSGKSLRSRKY